MKHLPIEVRMWNELAQRKTDDADSEAEKEDQIPRVEVQDFVFALMGFRIALVQSFQIMLPFLPFWMRWKCIFSIL